MISLFDKAWVRITSWVVLALFFILLVVEVVYLNRTYSEDDMKRAIVKVEHRTGYAIVADGKDALYFTDFSADSLFVGLDTIKASAMQSSYSTGVWINEWSFVPSCNGTVLAYDYAPDVDSISRCIYKGMQRVLDINIGMWENRIKQNVAIKKELDYYLSVHDAMDSEFGCISDYSVAKDKEQLANQSFFERLKAIASAKKLSIRPLSEYYLTVNEDSVDKELSCVLLPFVREDEESVSGLQYKKMDNKMRILQVGSLLLPEAACAVSFPMFTDFDYQLTDTVYVPKFGKKKVKRQLLSEAFAQMPMFDDSRRFLGFTPSECHHIGEADTLGYKLLGKSDVDSLLRGTFTDSLGTYNGLLTYNGVPNGLGTFSYHDGGYYEGEWLNGLRHGNGFLAVPGQMVKAGEWRDGIYKGERMVYNSYRVYGIDISRYQHEIGKRRYGIDWKNLRIIYLGAKNSGDAADSIDYPVSFVYIKSTQGTTIKSKYYAPDSKAARSHGILCGAYHFYSCKTRAIDQAKYFLKNTKIYPNDLPPVLDVEPSDREIARYGGEQKLFESIRVWMNTVEASTGKRPILYVSQRFIKDHLIKAPDICSKYQVWIARYGAYRPEVKLLFWQLTPYGRVRGIMGDVDINVFNGYREQFGEYKKSLAQ